MAKKLIRLYLLTMILFVLAGCIEHSEMGKNQDNNRMDYVHVNEDKFIIEYIPVSYTHLTLPTKRIV